MVSEEQELPVGEKCSVKSMMKITSNGACKRRPTQTVEVPGIEPGSSSTDTELLRA